MSSKSVKAKGRRLQNFVRDKLREFFPVLEDDDIKSQTMGMTGEDIVLSPHAKKLIPYSFECKNQEKLNIWTSMDQAEKNCPEDRDPVVVFTRNRKPTYVAMRFEDWCKKHFNNN